MLLDWACTPTTLYLGEWIKLEDIYSGLFIQECYLHFQQMENRRKGDRQPVRRKVLCGFLFFALLNLLVWLPLFIFSTGSLSQFDNYVSAGSLSVQLNGFPRLYEAASADYISPILPTDTWSVLAQTNPALALLPATSTNDYMRELQFVRLPRSSQELWKISPPAEAELLGLLEGRAKQTPQAAQADAEAAAAPVEAASVAATAVEMTLRFSFGTQDGSVNDGAVVHALSGEEKRQMAEIIRGNRTALRLQEVLPSIIRISTTKEVTPLLSSGDILGDCVLTFNQLGDGVSTNNTTPPPDTDGSAFVPLMTTAVGWWDFTCGSAARGCGTALEPLGPAAAVVEEDPVTGQPEPGCNPSIYTISSEKVRVYVCVCVCLVVLAFEQTDSDVMIQLHTRSPRQSTNKPTDDRLLLLALLRDHRPLLHGRAGHRALRAHVRHEQEVRHHLRRSAPRGGAQGALRDHLPGAHVQEPRARGGALPRAHRRVQKTAAAVHADGAVSTLAAGGGRRGGGEVVLRRAGGEGAEEVPVVWCEGVLNGYFFIYRKRAKQVI